MYSIFVFVFSLRRTQRAFVFRLSDEQCFNCPSVYDFVFSVLELADFEVVPAFLAALAFISAQTFGMLTVLRSIDSEDF